MIGNHQRLLRHGREMCCSRKNVVHNNNKSRLQRHRHFRMAANLLKQSIVKQFWFAHGQSLKAMHAEALLTL